ncbi:amidohydrolase family protein, partial [Bacillus licheniformis]
VNATGTCTADVLVDGERIAAVFAPGTSLGNHPPVVDRTIDATGKYVIPGGVDAHTHMEMPFGGTNASDTFETGTRAAAWGGTTTIVDFVVQKAGENPLVQYERWQEKAAGKCAIDYGFHQILSDVDDSS